MATKQTGFRLTENALENIEFMVNGGFARTATEAVIRALEYFVDQHKPTVDEETARQAVVAFLKTDEGKALIKSAFEIEEAKPVVIAESVEKVRIK
ncbi:hypothetical protein [Methanococcoides sp. AM1]|uniref:hypothetical protein n=1 Tax=Methanococcoides sp. AM1 TaxID=1201011 RepID=UPI0010832C70|nr:hypothetical protein [Methanococcoides sp. AM1]